MKIVKKCKREKEDLLIEGCKVMAEDMIKVNKELETADSDINWEDSITEINY